MTENISILMLHNYYEKAGGEDVSMASEMEVLRQKNHRVGLVEWHNHSIKAMPVCEKAALVFRTAWNQDSKNKVYDELKTLQADLLHVQNFFPLATPSVYTAARLRAVPVVQHLRNFRLGCLNAYLYRQGKVCEDCVGCNPWRGVLRRCYRGSLPASVSVWQMLTFHRWRRTWHKDVDAFVIPSRFAAKKLIDIGIPADKVHVKPNFVADPLPDQRVPPLPDRPHFVFAGRLSDEKGVLPLLRAWEWVKQPDWQLDILGDGPERSRLEGFCQEKGLQNVRFRGQLSAAQLLSVLQQSSLLLVPSLWYETFGRVVIEAFACGRGAMVSDLGALTELIDEGVNGCTVPAGDVQGWADRIRWCGENPAELASWGQAGRRTYQQYFTPDINYQRLMEIYDGVLTG
ncbi:MAG: glycosyltransferase family 4 protein [Cyanobacteria bacterium J06648_16]